MPANGRWDLTRRLEGWHNFSQAQYKLPDDGRRPKHVGATFMCILM
jgi:hypothetical protein